VSHPSRIWIGVAGAVALALLACLIGFFTTGLRLAVAGLSPGHGLFVVPIWHSILTGLILIGVGCATLAVSCAAAYLAAWRRWGFHGHDWQDIVEKRGVGEAWDSLHADSADGERRRAARKARFRHVSTRRKARRERRLAKVSRIAGLTMVADSRNRVADDFEAAAQVQGKAADEHLKAAGEHPGTGHVTDTAAGSRLLRILAGFNLLVLAGGIALGVGQAVAAFESSWWAVIPAGVIAFLLVHRVLTTLGPLDAHPRAHIASWVLVGALAAASSPPVGLLVITGVILSTWGRKFVRANAAESLALRLTSPLPWVTSRCHPCRSTVWPSRRRRLSSSAAACRSRMTPST
jgi:hypothetical protein